MTIALDLGVSRGMVRRACERHGLDGQPDGPRRGVTAAAQVAPLALDPTCQAIVDRTMTWKRRRVPATETTLSAAIQAARAALAAGETNAYDAALIDIAAAAALVHSHRQKLRRAA